MRQDPREVVRAATSLVASLEKELADRHGLSLPDFEILDVFATAETGALTASEVWREEVSLSRAGTRQRVLLLKTSRLLDEGGWGPYGGRLFVLTQAGAATHRAALGTLTRVVESTGLALRDGT